MSFWNLVRNLRGSPVANRSLRRPGLARRSCRPVLEALEDRCLLSYAITDLGTLYGGNSFANGINASGQVVGSSTYAGFSSHAFLYDGTATPAMQDIGTLGGLESAATGGINASGQVAGRSLVAGNVEHAFLYDATVTPAMQDLGTLGGQDSFGWGINDSGQVVGESWLADNLHTHAFLYDGTAIQDLGTLGGPANFSRAFAINASSQVVGVSSPPLGGQHAFLYDATAAPAMQDLGTLGGLGSRAFAINASGQVVGAASTVGNAQEDAFLYDGIMHDLGTLHSGTVSIAYGINASGQVVGWSTTNGQGAGVAFLYDATVAPAMQDLNDLISAGSGWVLQHANAINDSGQIAGDGRIGGLTHAFLLTPVRGPGPAATPHGTLASLATLPVPVNTAFVVGGGSMLAADSTFASTAALEPVLAAFDRAPVPAPWAPTVSDRHVDAAPALAHDLAVTPEQSASLHLGSGHAADGLDQFFADLGQDMWRDGRPISW